MEKAEKFHRFPNYVTSIFVRGVLNIYNLQLSVLNDCLSVSSSSSAKINAI